MKQKFQIGDIVGKDLDIYPHNIGTICDVYVDKVVKECRYLIKWNGQIGQIVKPFNMVF